MNNLDNSLCSFQESAGIEMSDLRPYPVRMLKKIPNMFFTFGNGLKYKLLRKTNAKVQNPTFDISLNLQPGDTVEVRSIREIAATLDEHGKYKGLYFMPEMEKFCGHRFKVFKKAEKIKLETNGQLRKLRHPGYFLEGVYCDGIIQGGCDRSCFHFWRDAWLRKIIE